MKILMSHDLTCALDELRSAACRVTRSPYFAANPDLAITAVAFTIQLAIEAGHDPAQLRALERELIGAVHKELAP